jgi:hypothetical protein
MRGGVGYHLDSALMLSLHDQVINLLPATQIDKKSDRKLKP